MGGIASTAPSDRHPDASRLSQSCAEARTHSQTPQWAEADITQHNSVAKSFSFRYLAHRDSV